MLQPAEAVAGPPAEHSGTHLDNLTCAICLDQIAPCNIASIPQCDHQYCGRLPATFSFVPLLQAVFSAWA